MDECRFKRVRIMTGDKWQLKTLFLAIFDPSTSIVKSFFICCLSDVGFYQCVKTFLTFPWTNQKHRRKKYKNIQLDLTSRIENCVCTGPLSAVGNMSDCRYMSDCRSRGRDFYSPPPPPPPPPPLIMK